jgi:hypothetical protein
MSRQMNTGRSELTALAIGEEPESSLARWRRAMHCPQHFGSTLAVKGRKRNWGTTRPIAGVLGGGGGLEVAMVDRQKMDFIESPAIRSPQSPLPASSI